jgi:hypothetical protein
MLTAHGLKPVHVVVGGEVGAVAQVQTKAADSKHARRKGVIVRMGSFLFVLGPDSGGRLSQCRAEDCQFRRSASQFTLQP